MEISDFRMVTLEAIHDIGEVYAEHPPMHSDYCLTTMLGWEHYMDYLYARIGGHLAFMTRKDGKVTVRGPIGGYSDREMTDILEFSLSVGSEPPMGVLDQEMVRRVRKVLPDIATVPRREYFDYVYSATDLRDLPGKDFLNHRNLLNNFRRSRRYSVEPIDRGNIDEARHFFRRWCEMRRCEEEPILESEKRFIAYSMDHFEVLGLEGLMIRVDGEIEASSVFEALSPNTAVTHIEKANPGIKGIYQAINQETAAVLADRFEFINRESDMGVPGLRMAKERYRPHHMVEVHQVQREELARVLGR